MARAISDIEEEIRALSPVERERLLRVLLNELDVLPDPDVERAWLDEARRRSHEFAESPTLASDVFVRARADL